MYAQTIRLSKITLGRHLISLRRRWYSSVLAPGLADPVGYCKELVRKHDYESFLLAPFYPKHAQAGYFAIKAFSVGSSVFSYGAVDERDAGRACHGTGQRVNCYDWCYENAVLEGCITGLCSGTDLAFLKRVTANRIAG